MSRVVSVTEASQYDIKEKIPAMRGRITRVNKVNAVGQGTCQNLELSDEQNPNVKLKLKLWDGQEVPKSWVNSVVYLESGQDKRSGGPRGLEIAQDTYEWSQGDPAKKLIELREGAGATMTLSPYVAPPQEQAPNQQNTGNSQRGGPSQRPESPGPSQGSGQRPGPSERQPAQNNPPPREERDNPDQNRQEPPPRSESRAPKTPDEIKAEEHERQRKAVVEAKRWLQRRVNGLRMIFRAVDKFADERRELGKPMSPEAMQALCSSAMIDAHKVSLFQQFPVSREEFEKIFPPEESSAKS